MSLASQPRLSVVLAVLLLAATMGCENSREGGDPQTAALNHSSPYPTVDMRTTNLEDFAQWTGLYDIQEGDEDWISNLSLKIEPATARLKEQFGLRDLLVASGVIADFNTGENVVFSGSLVVPTEDGGAYFSLGPFRVTFALAPDGSRILLCGGHVYRRQE